MKDRGISWKITNNFYNFLENLRATRRSKIVGTDEKMLTQLEACDVIVKYFKLNNDRFMELIKLEMEQNGIK